MHYLGPYFRSPIEVSVRSWQIPPTNAPSTMKNLSSSDNDQIGTSHWKSYLLGSPTYASPIVPASSRGIYCIKLHTTAFFFTYPGSLCMWTGVLDRHHQNSMRMRSAYDPVACIYMLYITWCNNFSVSFLCTWLCLVPRLLLGAWVQRHTWMRLGSYISLKSILISEQYLILQNTCTSAEKASRSSSTENCPTRGFSAGFWDL